MSKRNFTDRILNTELVGDLNMRGVVIQLDRRIQQIESIRDNPNRIISDPCPLQVIATADGLTELNKLRVQLDTRGNPIKLGLQPNPPPDTFTYSIGGSNGACALILQLYRDDIYVDVFPMSYTETGSANPVTITPPLAYFTDLFCSSGRHIWTLKASVTGSFSIQGMRLFAYENIG